MLRLAVRPVLRLTPWNFNTALFSDPRSHPTGHEDPEMWSHVPTATVEGSSARFTWEITWQEVHQVVYGPGDPTQQEG